MTHTDPMQNTEPSMAEQIAQAATAFQQQRTGYEPKSVSVVLCGDTLVVTLHGVLTPAEQAVSQTSEGAAKLLEFHRQLFLNSSETLRAEIKRITGMDVREVTAEVEPESGTVVHVFTSGTMVQVFLLSGSVPSGCFEAGNEAEDGADRQIKPPSEERLARR